MNIHEYQAKSLLRQYRVTTPRGEVVYTSKAAARVAEELGGQRWVVKAQIHAGGRGKGGGVKIGNSPAKIAEIADQMLGSTLVTAQTGPEGQRVSRVLVERASRIEREFYLSLVVDRDSQRIVVIASAEGGVDIEEVAASDPDAIHTEYIDPGVGLVDFQCRKVATAIGLGKKTTSFTRLLKRMYRLFRDLDCLHARGQPVHRDRGRRARRARREDELRRERAVPPGRRGRAARLRRGGPQGGRGLGPRPELHRPRRLGRLHRERRRASRWARWTRSATTAAAPRTSSTWAAARAPRRSRTRSASC